MIVAESPKNGKTMQTILKTNFKPGVLALSALALSFYACSANAQVDTQMLGLDLEEILNLEITSVSKKPQTVSQAAAAVFVITAEDIRRMGATSIPEALRMAPGLQVAQISGNAWAISSRGLNGRFSNKLLVLMDGRSVYSPVFSGVFWDVQDTVMADIERIEVIRGPGAATWGANAVNGVINVITKSAASTQGGQATAVMGGLEGNDLTVRQGGELANDMGHWRVYAKDIQREGTVIRDTGWRGADTTRQQRVGFRSDLAPTAIDSVTVQGDYYTGVSGESARFGQLTPQPGFVVTPTRQDLWGGNVLGRWQRQLSGTDSFTVQTYLDQSRRDWPGHLVDTQRTMDVDFQYRTRTMPGHDVIVGGGYRTVHSTVGLSPFALPAGALQYTAQLNSETRRKLFSVLVQDDITLMPDKVVLTLGGKLENHEPSGSSEFMPNVRLLYTPNRDSTYWGAVSRAVRTPSHIDEQGQLILLFPPNSVNNPSDFYMKSQNNGRFTDEKVLAYEAGLKRNLTPQLSLEASAYYNMYDNIRSASINSPMPQMLCAQGGMFPMCVGGFANMYAYLPVDVGNLAQAKSHGLELSTHWRVQNNLKLQASVSQFKMTVTTPSVLVRNMDFEGSAPQWSGNLRVAWSPRSDMDLDLMWRRVGQLTDTGYGYAVPAYSSLALRWAWRPSKNVELAVVGHDLLKKYHTEFFSEIGDHAAMSIQRSIHGQIRLKF